MSLSGEPCRSWRADQFSHSELERLRPSLLRSKGMTRKPRARRSPVDRPATSCVSSGECRPDSISSRPASARTSVRCPLPSTPATPTISPGAMARLTSPSAGPSASGRVETRSATRIGRRLGRRPRPRSALRRQLRADQRFLVPRGQGLLGFGADDCGGKLARVHRVRRRPALRSAALRAAPSPCRRPPGPPGSCEERAKR